MHFLDHIWTFVTDVVNVYIYSIILQILMNMVVHVDAFKSGLVSCDTNEILTWDRVQFVTWTKVPT